MIFKWFPVCKQIQQTLINCIDVDGNIINGIDGNTVFHDWDIIIGSLGSTRNSKKNSIEISAQGEGDIKLAPMRDGNIIVYIDVYYRTDEKDTEKVCKQISAIQENMTNIFLRLPLDIKDSVSIGVNISTAISGISFGTPWATFSQALQINWKESRNY
jgi:hypothetical protein